MNLIQEDDISLGDIDDAEEGLCVAVDDATKGEHDGLGFRERGRHKRGSEIDEVLDDTDTECEGRNGMKGDDKETERMAVRVIGGESGVVGIGMEGGRLHAGDGIFAVKGGVRKVRPA